MFYQRPRQLDDRFQVESRFGSDAESLDELFEKFELSESHFGGGVEFDGLLQ